MSNNLEAIKLRIPPDWIAAIDAARGNQGSRQDFLRRIIRNCPELKHHNLELPPETRGRKKNGVSDED